MCYVDLSHTRQLNRDYIVIPTSHEEESIDGKVYSLLFYRFLPSVEMTKHTNLTPMRKKRRIVPFFYLCCMKNLAHQTQQAFYFSLGFYILAILFKILDFPLANVLISIALLLSLTWVFLALREVILSPFLSTTERILLIIFIIFGNVLAGVAYFFFMRDKVLGLSKRKK